VARSDGVSIEGAAGVCVKRATLKIIQALLSSNAYGRTVIAGISQRVGRSVDAQRHSVAIGSIWAAKEEDNNFQIWQYRLEHLYEAPVRL
jgi:hypothetical protein